MKIRSLSLALAALSSRHSVSKLCMVFAAALVFLAGAARPSPAQTAHFVGEVGSVAGVVDKATAIALSIKPDSVDFSSISVGSSSPKSTLTFTFDRGGTINAPLVLTKGEPGQDFHDAGTGTCTTNGSSKVYSAGDSCTIDVVFSPKYSGTREGAAVLTDASGKRIATAYIYGQGVGSQVTFLPARVTTVLTVTGPVESLDIDESGNLYLADDGNSEVVKETLAGGKYTQSILDSGLFNTFSVAVDGGGSVYFADPGTSQVFEETPSGTGFIQSVVPVPSAGRGVGFIAVDPGGNVYVSLSNGSGIVKETLSGDTYTESKVVATQGIEPFAVDSRGNVYLTDAPSASILKETLSAGTYTQSTVAPANSSSAVAVDGSGSVYIADVDKGILKEMPVDSGYMETVLSPKPSGDYVYTIAIDGAGDLYGGTVLGLVEKIDLSDPPSLNFASTAIGATSSDSPQTVTASNIGTASLTFPIFEIGNNPSISAGFVLGSSETSACPILTPESSTAGTLAAGSSCNIEVSFKPVAPGLDAGSLVLTDNALNQLPNATQTISLNGTGTGTGAPQAVLTPTSYNFGTATVGGTSPYLDFKLTNTGTAQLLISSISITGPGAAQFTQTNSCSGSLAPTGVCTIAVDFTPTAAGTYSASLSIADNARESPQAASLTGVGVTTTTPQAVLSPASIAFGNITAGTTSPAQTLTLSNPGTGTLTISDITVIGTNSSKFAQTNSCGNSLAAGSNCKITVSFSPDVAGAFSASISVADDANGSPQTAALSGTGVAVATPQAVLTPAVLAFPNTAVGSSATTLSAQLSNPGTASLTITSIVVAGSGAGAFTQTNTCGASLAAGATCSISVGFKPTAATAYTASLTVTDNAANATQATQLSGSGAAVVVSDFSISAANSPQTIDVGASGQYNITLTPLNGSFTNEISLSVAGLPAGVSGTLSPASVTPGASSVSSTLTVAVANSFSITTKALPQAPPQSGKSRLEMGGAVITFAILFMPWLSKKRTRFRGFQLVLAALLLGGIGCLAGCGAGGFAGHSVAKTYTLTVTGSSGSTQHATTVILTVK